MTVLDPVREACLERCGALADFWYVACLAAELGTKRPLGRTVFGVPIALFRDESGRARAVRDRCLHRGTALSEGVVLEGKLCCPYHGWSYDGAGRCVRVPSQGPLAQLQEGEACLRTFATREQDGLVYVHLGRDPAGPRQNPFSIPLWNDLNWTTYFMVTPFDNGVTNLVENFMDVPHTVFVHRGWFRAARHKRVPAEVARVNGNVLVTYQQEQDRLSGLGTILNPLGTEPMVHTDKYYFPNITRVDYTWGERSGFVITSQCTPVGPWRSLVYTSISYRLPYDGFGHVVAKFLKPLIRWYTRQVITQDTAIMAAQTKGLRRGNEPIAFHNTQADQLHEDIEDTRAWLLAGGHGTPPEDHVHDITLWI